METYLAMMAQTREDGTIKKRGQIKGNGWDTKNTGGGYEFAIIGKR